ncbi:MAG: AAA family ATPase [Candidatus Baltobacteraceae bacterium]
MRPVLCRPLVGRREELAYLRERRLEAGRSHGGLTLIAGEAGVGKSRLISEFCRSLAYSRWRIGAGPCLEFARRPYGPFLEALARLDSGTWELSAASSKQEQLDTIVERLATVASRAATIVVIEDLHWADAATLDLLAYVGPKLQPMRVLMLASFRADELNPEHPATEAVAKIARRARAGRIDLGPLAGAELRTFIDEALDGLALSVETRRAIAIAGDGNPFFTEELLKSAVEREATRVDAGQRRQLPQTVRSTLLERLRPFDQRERRVVTQAAVIGRTFGLALLATTLGTDAGTLLPTLRRARDFQLIEEVTPETFRFRHGLTREAISSDFLAAELRPLHRKIVLALEGEGSGPGSLEALAYHAWAAGDGERTARYNELAGDAAGAVHAHGDAIAFYDRALEADGIEQCVRGSILEKIAGRRVALTSTEEATAAYGAAADLFRDAGDYEREAGCRVSAAISAYTLGLPSPTAPLEAMLARLGPDEYIARSRAHLGLAWLAASFWFPTRATAHLEQVDSRAVAATTDIALRFHNVSAWVAMTLGDLECFRREHAAWVEAAVATGSVGAIASAHYNGATCFSIFGLHEEALDNIARALRLARDGRSRHGAESAHAIAAMCYIMSGDLGRVRGAIDAMSETTENQVNVALASGWGTLAGAYLDDRALIEKWFDGFETTISATAANECGAGYAEIMVRRGRNRDAAAFLHYAIPDCERIRGIVPTLLAAARYGASADRVRARELLVRTSDAPIELLERPALALFDAFTCQREERWAEATALARGAADGFRRLRFPLLEAAAWEVAGEPGTALSLYRRCGATYDVRRLEELDLVAPSEPAAQTPDPLSSREREIVELAARGRSNLDIAAKLFISHKTVEKHLTSAYRKLGVSSRQALASLLV